jgi:hypothetical protein
MIISTKVKLTEKFFFFSDKWQLSIPGMVASDEGNYTCVVHNPHGLLRHNFRVEALSYLTHKPGK